MKVRTRSAKRLIKRVARRACAAASGVLGVGRAGPTPGVRLLTYHRIAADHEDPFSVPPVAFARQMESLSATGLVVTMDQSLEALERGEAERPRIVLTFDDGTNDFVAAALPVLLRLRLPSTLYVSPGRVGSRGFLDWPDLERAARAGVTIGSHGMDHQSLARLTPSDLRRQATDSRRILEDRLGREVRSMAYPFGTVRDFNAPVKEALRDAGYRSACTSVNGVNRSGVDLLELCRTKIEQGDDEIFQAILGGGLDAWAFFDRHLSMVQNRYA